jgi:hypothetical protein
MERMVLLGVLAWAGCDDGERALPPGPGDLAALPRGGDAAMSGADASGARAVACGIRACDVDANEVCCVDLYEGPEVWPCVPSAGCTATGRACDGPEDCGGRPCCANRAWGSSCLPVTESDCGCPSPDSSQCAVRVCHSADDCRSGQACLGNFADLPTCTDLPD